MKNIICLVGGKSGGHILPLITLAQKNNLKNILFFAANTPLDKQILQEQTFTIAPIFLSFDTGKKNIKNILKFTHAFFISLYLLFKHKPEKIISTGGAVSLPVCIAGFILFIPIELYELNAVPGKATNILSYFAKTIFICFSETKKFFSKKNCIVTQYPISYAADDLQFSKQNAKKDVGLDPDLPVLLIIGGSQGSDFLNKLIINTIENIKKEVGLFQIIHITGDKDQLTYTNVYTKQHITAIVLSYTSQMKQYYQSANIAISRGGAGTLAELSFFNIQSIIIPLQTNYTNHQVDNAYAAQKQYPELFHVHTQDNLETNPNLIIKTIKQIF